MSPEAQTRTSESKISVLQHIISRLVLKLFYFINILKKIDIKKTALKLLWNGSEKVRKRVVSLEAQTRTNEPKITVLQHIKSRLVLKLFYFINILKKLIWKKTALKLLWNGSEKVRKRVVSLEAQTRTNEPKITVLQHIKSRLVLKLFYFINILKKLIWKKTALKLLWNCSEKSTGKGSVSRGSNAH